MGNNDSSDFIYTQTSIDDIEMLDRSGATSLACKARINGRVYFMKKLRPELRGDKLCHEVFAKEFNTGKGIKSPYVAKYIDMKDDGDGLYIIMEYVSGKTLKEKIAAQKTTAKSKVCLKKSRMRRRKLKNIVPSLTSLILRVWI